MKLIQVTFRVNLLNPLKNFNNFNNYNRRMENIKYIWD